jgi:ADP-ribose pyrophosphatase YjhB (NUDIX family)
MSHIPGRLRPPDLSAETNSPIVSCGIIVIDHDLIHNRESTTTELKLEDFKVLLAQRRDSFAYTEFIRGDLPVDKQAYHFALMTDEERQRLLKYDFRRLWNDLILNQRAKFYQREYSRCEQHFQAIKNSGRLKELVESTVSSGVHCPWGFPKGRNKSREDHLDCALREFQEEMHIPSASLKILNPKTPLIHDYVGSDDKAYQSLLFVGVLRTADRPTPKYRSTPQAIRASTLSDEIGTYAWMTMSQATPVLDNKSLDCIRRAIGIVSNWLAHSRRYSDSRRCIPGTGEFKFFRWRHRPFVSYHS